VSGPWSAPGGAISLGRVWALGLVAAGDQLLAPAITRRLIDRYAHESRPPCAGSHEALARLTPRELEVVVQVARGLSDSQIAEALVIDEATVKTHVANILAKLGLQDRVQIVVFAYEEGVVEAGDRRAEASR